MIWWALLIVFGSGLLGGMINAVMTDNGFAMPMYDKSADPPILRPGYLGNMLIGGVAAAISWGLYGPAAAVALLPTVTGEGPGVTATIASGSASLTLAGFVGGILVGIAGARWLSNEVDKNLLRAAGSQAALAKRNDDLAAKIALSTPADALKEARNQASKTEQEH